AARSSAMRARRARQSARVASRSRRIDSAATTTSTIPVTAQAARSQPGNASGSDGRFGGGLMRVTAAGSCPQERGAPVQPRAERREADEVSRADAPGGLRLVVDEREGRRGRVAVLLDVVEDLVVREAEALLGRLVDAEIRLVHQQEREVRRG